MLHSGYQYTPGMEFWLKEEDSNCMESKGDKRSLVYILSCIS
ncbi:hypothetical protein [Nostoc sp. JL31]|nr:hypothetical protein [Nostoc sp. JL31]